MEIGRKSLYIIAGVVCGLIIWLLLDLAITTDKERITRKMDALFGAAAEGDAEGMITTVSPDYEFDDLTWHDWNGIVQGYFKVFGATKVNVLGKSINVEGKLAVLDISVYARSTGPLRHSGRSRWRLSWRKQKDEWMITRIKLRSLSGRQVDGLPQEVLRLRAQ